MIQIKDIPIARILLKTDYYRVVNSANRRKIRELSSVGIRISNKGKTRFLSGSRIFRQKRDDSKPTMSLLSENPTTRRTIVIGL